MPELWVTGEIIYIAEPDLYAAIALIVLYASIQWKKNSMNATFE